MGPNGGGWQRDGLIYDTSKVIHNERESDGGEGKSLLYSEVKLVSILEGQESVEIIILTDGGKELRIPVSDRDGKYSDCMVMLRFLDRVVADAKKYPYE